MMTSSPAYLCRKAAGSARQARARLGAGSGATEAAASAGGRMDRD